MGMGNSGVVDYRDKEGRRVYMAYTPLGNSEWYLMGFVPVEVVNAKSELLMRTTLLPVSYTHLSGGTLRGTGCAAARCGFRTIRNRKTSRRHG